METRSEYVDRISHLIEQTVRSQLGGIVDQVVTRFEDDFEGEPSLFTDVLLNDTAPTDLGWRFATTRVSVLNALKDIGENRFPYLSTKRPNDDYPEDLTIKSRKRRA